MTSARSRRSRHTAAVLGALTALALAATGCATVESAPVAGDAAQGAQLAGTATVSTVLVDGVERSYRLHVPTQVDPDTRVPLLLVVHGAGSSAERAEVATGMNDLADAGGFIVAYPQGTQAADVAGEYSWNAGDCCGAPAAAGTDDVGYITAVIADVEEQHPIDADRIAVAGFSNGGMLANRLACELDGVFDGIAVVAGTRTDAKCAATAATRVLLVHGTGDLTVPFDGGKTNERTAARFGQWTNASVQNSVDYWADRGACSAEPTVVVDGDVTTASWQGCAEGASLALVSIADGGHVWPIAAVSGFDASTFIVEYLGLGAGAPAR